MDEHFVQQFKQKYETLAGSVHLVASATEAAEKVLSILRGAGAHRVALGQLPEDFRHPLAQRCAQAGLDVMMWPFDSAELPQALDSVQAGVSWAAFAIAETGSLVEFTTDDAVRLVSALPRVHVGVFRTTDLLGTLEEAAPRIRNFYAENPRNGTVSFISGPSRTGDIEMRLTLGVHGPADTHAVVITSNHQNLSQK
jgi:L-lactate dehydrogenase complex protein LldG